MNRTRLGALMIVVGVSSCMWACGDDDDDTGPTAGTGGRAGSSTGGNGGKAGSTTGGNGGKAGNTTGGTAGKAGGAPLGGEGGTDVGGTAGAGPGGGGAGGEPSAGAGGEALGGNGGMGGEGGDPPMLTQAEACDAQCQAFFTEHPAVCAGSTATATDCTTNCTGYDSGDPDVNGLFLTYMQCAVDKVAATDLVCGDETTTASSTTPMWPVAAGACETELCAWTCADQTFIDAVVFDRCGC